MQQPDDLTEQAADAAEAVVSSTRALQVLANPVARSVYIADLNMVLERGSYVGHLTPSRAHAWGTSPPM